MRIKRNNAQSLKHLEYYLAHTQTDVCSLPAPIIIFKSLSYSSNLLKMMPRSVMVFYFSNLIIVRKFQYFDIKYWYHFSIYNIHSWRQVMSLHKYLLAPPAKQLIFECTLGTKYFMIHRGCMKTVIELTMHFIVIMYRPTLKNKKVFLVPSHP